MRAIPIEDGWVPPDCSRQVLAAPNGDLNDPDIAPLEVILDPGGGPFEDPRSVSMTSMWLLDEAERDAVTAGGLIVLVVMGVAHPPVALGVATLPGHGR